MMPPAVLLNPITCTLLTQVWGQSDLLSDAIPLRRRRVAWGDAAAVDVPDPGMSVGGAALLDRLEHEFTARVAGRPMIALEHSWVLDARGRPRGEHEGNRPAGHRCIIAAEIDAAPEAGGDTAVIASVREGWVFALPASNGRMLVQAMVAEAPADPAATLTHILAATALPLRPLLAVPGLFPSGPVVFPAAPGLAPRLAEPGRLRVGDRGVAVDPLCGDGTGNAVRAALLACACAAAVEEGAPEDAVLAHYENRLHTAYAAHLRTCIALYQQAFNSAAWRAELGAMRASLARIPQRRPAAYGLAGRSLVPLVATTPA
ncbi:hypothetical protein [Arthrobacter sp. Leaf337]|uniref:hypothetical protein n=1 Tax=Arthrobacter sp. Leaf337 TaxID=1736342 RepID=UPI0012E2D01D|nr:hypothetical protein [Arthrobacter sp. Leaf337]